MVAAAVPGRAVRGGDQRVCLLGGEVADDGAFASPWWDRQDLADHGGVFGCVEGRVVEQGVDGGQPGVTGGAAVAPAGFQVLQERADKGGVQVGEAESAGRLSGLGLGEGKQKPAGVAVGGDRVRAGLLLPGEPVGEESLQDSGEVGHRAARLSACSSRLAARASSSGTACRYQ